MEQEILTKEKIRSILKSIVKTEFEFKNLKVDQLHFSNEICKVDCEIQLDDGNRREFHWMIKLLPLDKSGEKLKVNLSLKLDEKETIFYREIFPEFAKIVCKKEIELNYANCPYGEFTIKAEDDYDFVLVMDNLGHQGFKGAPVKTPYLNLDYIMLTLIELAKFHALGHVFLKTQKDQWANIKEDTVYSGDNIGSKFARDLGRETSLKWVPIMKACEEQGQGLSDLLDKMMNDVDVIDSIYKMHKSDPKEFNTLCHGDVWFSNVLFKHDDHGKPTKCALIDFGGAHYGNPTKDVAYFLFTSIAPNLRRTHYDRLLGIYHDALIKFFFELGQDPSVYPYQQFRKDYDKYVWVGFGHSMAYLPEVFMKAIKSDDVIAMCDKESLIKSTMVGNFIEMMERGFFNKYM